MTYIANPERYNRNMPYPLCGKSGLKIPAVSLGLWHNFGHTDDFENARAIVEFAFDSGINHFDLANNYGPPPGSAEENFGKILRTSLAAHRDEILISTKAGHLMWEGPFGDGSSRKNLIASLNQSLKRMGTEYVDIFYSHRYDGITPIEETMQTLVDIVRAGKALYVGLSKYPAEVAEKCYTYLKEQNVPCLINQDRYSMLNRNPENGVLQAAEKNGVGFCAFSPLAQGLLTNRYLNGIPEGSRAAKDGFLKKDQITPERVDVLKKLNDVAVSRDEELSQMALAWLLANPQVTTVLVGASSAGQLERNLRVLNSQPFSAEQTAKIDTLLNAYRTI